MISMRQKMNKKNLLRGELIGLETEIVESENNANKGIKGKVIDETKNMITIKGKKTWRLIKKQNMFKFGKTSIEGRLLVDRPEERIKTRSIKWLEKRKM